MESVVVPKITVSFAVDLEVEYDAFSGRTAQEMAELLQDKLDDLLPEVDRRVISICTSITSIDDNWWQWTLIISTVGTGLKNKRKLILWNTCISVPVGKLRPIQCMAFIQVFGMTSYRDWETDRKSVV